MKLHNLEKANNHEVIKWLEDNIVELTAYQKERIRNDEIVRFSTFQFYKKRKKGNKNFFTRLTIIPYGLTWFLLFLGLPFNFIIKGNWGYDKIDWFAKWGNKIGI